MGRDVYEENVLSPNKNRAQFMESECIQVYGIEEFQFSAFITEKKKSQVFVNEFHINR